MADKTIFGRLQKLFSTNTIVRKTKDGVKVIDTDEYQSMTTNLVDRFVKLRMSGYSGAGLAESSDRKSTRLNSSHSSVSRMPSSA